MALSRFVKAEARELYLQGASCQEIAEELEINLRTVQRWVKEFEGETVTVTIAPEVEPEHPVEALQRLAQSPPDVPLIEQPIGSAIELNLTARIAVRLLGLTEVAVDTIEEILTSGDASHGSRLKAVQILSQWVGLCENGRSTVMGNVTHKLGLNCSDDYEESQVIFTPRSN